MCSNKYGPVKSETFHVQVDCPNDIKVFEPDLDPSWISQLYDATKDNEAKSAFVFDSFRTTTSACQVE